ncbi:molybdate ABC transporter substrate-binding protein [Bacillus sp. FJAT-28004]|uniref:molybdate ABC transporter substrate-binding protein n=1 Tax=Bacillus sp. FJAT-28004 TaxID=1679165 RepID=UPI0006B64E5F|nr:molybdate ABC transporter substrate-binding protein [Bacillus sp. FJAT-28004]
MNGLIRKSYVLFSLIMILVVVTACGSNPSNSTNQPEATAISTEAPAANVELTISAAASLTDALKEIEAQFKEVHPNVKLNFNFGASGALQKQIENGAPADLFLSAASKNMKSLVDANLIAEDSQTNLLSNGLVLITSKSSKTNLTTVNDLLNADVKTIAIGIPESVPAGSYTKEALEQAKLWDSLQAKVVQAKDVRQVLQYVETGNADAGFVYKTDALASDKVNIVLTVDPSTYTPISYPIGIVTATKHLPESKQFYDYLQTEDAMAVFEKFGFSRP